MKNDLQSGKALKIAGKEKTPEEIARQYHIQSEKKPSPEKMARRYGRVKTPTVYQMEVSECGAASLSMIMQFYGKYVPLEELRVETGVSRNGCNARNICTAAEHYGLKYTASARSFERLIEKNDPPCMLHWNYSHFVVFEGIKGKKYYINDPQYGRRKLTREEMEECYSGTVLEFVPGDDFTESKSKRTLWNFTKERLKGQKSALLALILMGIALIIPGVLNPVFSQIFADEILEYGQISWVKWLLLAMLLTTLFDVYYSYLSARLSLYLKTKLSVTSTNKMISHMLRLPLGFFEQRYTGDLVSRVYNNMAVSSFLAEKLVQLFISLMTSVVYLVIMLLYNPQLSLIGVGFSCISMFIAVRVSKYIASKTMKFGMDSGKLQGAFFNGLSSSASLKAVGAENEFIARIFGYYAEVTDNDQKLGKMQTTLNMIPKMIGTVNSVALLIMGSHYVVEGTLTPGMLIAFTGFLGSFSSPFGNIVGFVRSMQQVKNDMARVEDIMRYEEEPLYSSEKDESISANRLNGQIDVMNVDFAYGKLDNPLIRDFELHLEPGQTIALVGTSGCGKSTVSKLLSGLYQPWKGNVYYDGRDINTIPSSVMSASVAVVTQSISIFEGTISENISTWNQSISQEDIIKAAKDACIHDEITMKKGGYDYILKENGSNISGGQRQRIEIAKALAGNPTILLLDEATSSLDTATEKNILDNIKRRHLTMVLVAQRLSTIRDCDEIIVMDRGKVVERGTHKQLVAAKGLYYNLIAQSE